MTEKKYFIGETIGCTPENQKLALEDFASLGYSAKPIGKNAIRITGTPSKCESEIVRSRKVNGITLTGDEYTQIRGIILETMELLAKEHLLPGIVLSLEVAQHILEKEDKNP